MRIAMLGHKRVPSHEGGIEVVVEELAARMVEKGHQVTCFNRTGQHVSGKEYEVQKLDEYRGIRIRRVPTLDKKGLAAVTSSFFASLAAALDLSRALHSVKLGIIHQHCRVDVVRALIFPFGFGCPVERRDSQTRPCCLTVGAY